MFFLMDIILLEVDLNFLSHTCSLSGPKIVEVSLIVDLFIQDVSQYVTNTFLVGVSSRLQCKWVAKKYGMVPL